MILLDASGLLTAIDVSQPKHESVRRLVQATDERLILSPFILAELDYLVGQRVGSRAADALLQQVEAGVYELAPFSAQDVGRARRILEQYRDLGIGLVNASLVVLAARLGTNRILTLDERHFRVLRLASGAPFTILPADA